MPEGLMGECQLRSRPPKLAQSSDGLLLNFRLNSFLGFHFVDFRYDLLFKTVLVLIPLFASFFKALQWRKFSERLVRRGFAYLDL